MQQHMGIFKIQEENEDPESIATPSSKRTHCLGQVLAAHPEEDPDNSKSYPELG